MKFPRSLTATSRMKIAGSAEKPRNRCYRRLKRCLRLPRLLNSLAFQPRSAIKFVYFCSFPLLSNFTQNQELSFFQFSANKLNKDGNRSAEVFCEYGVPQGSVLRPLLFTLYVAPVANVITSHGVSHLQYADDTQLYIALDKDESIEILQNCADAVYSWFAQNGLSLNPEKSEAILLGTGARLRREDQIPSVSFAETTVGTRTSVKSLGVTIDSGLTFNEHVDNICKASAYHIRSLRHIRKFIDEDAATSVTTALVSARIDYCNSLLYGTSKSNIDKLQRLQNSLARAVMCTGKFGSITPVLAALHWLSLSISARITYKVALLTRKVLTTQRPGYLLSLIRVNQPTRQLRPSTHRVLCSTAPRTAFASRAFCHAAPAVWNELPNMLNFIHSTVSLSEFKRNLKSFLFKQSFPV